MDESEPKSKNKETKEWAFVDQSKETQNKRLKEVFSDLQTKAPDFPPDKFKEFLEEIMSRVEYLKSKYPDWRERRVIHILSSSSLDPSSKIIEEDFPGEDSVQKFVNDLVQKYKS